MNGLDEFMKNYRENVIIKGKEELITEASIIQNDNRFKISVAVNGDGEKARNFIEDPYFKVHDSQSPGDENSVARIYVKRAEYVKDHKGKPTYTLNSPKRKELVKALRAVNKKTGNVYWEELKAAVIAFDPNGKYSTPEERKEILDLPMPDYRNL